MTTNSLSIKLLSLFFCLILLNSCKPHKPGVWKNENIESGARDNFDDLNQKLLNGLKANSPQQLEMIMSKEFIQNTGRLRLIELCSNRLKEDDYKILDQYYLVNSERGVKINDAKTNSINNYKITYEALAREMYMVFFVPKSIPNKYMIGAQYCKFDYGWKLTALEVEPYTFNGKTAPELFEEAKVKLSKKYVIDAMDDIQNALLCAKPFDGWEYTKTTGMDTLHDDLIDLLNKKYVFPFTLTQLSTRPQVFSITTQSTPEGVFPAIYYKSNIKLTNIAGLKKENEEIKKLIGKLMPGIDKEKKYVYYDAFNEWPRYDRSVDRYEIIDQLK